jgi:uncharacterized protein YdaU (DUF1376 family)
VKRPWMPFYVADYLADTTHLTTQQHGAYVLLMLRYWATGSIPNDDAQLAQIVRLDYATWQIEKAIVLAFFRADLSHKRIEQELQKTASIPRKRSASAKRRHTSKSEQQTESSPQKTSANAAQVQTQTQTQSQKIGGGGDARARAPLVTDAAMKVADEVAHIAGIDPVHPPPQWCGAAMHVSKWLREGWTRDVITVAAKTAMAKKRDGPPVSIRFFEHEIAREFARRSAPLPKVVQPLEQATMRAHEKTADYQPADWRSRRDDQHAARAELRAFVNAHTEPAADSGSGVNGPTLRLVPNAGCG